MFLGFKYRLVFCLSCAYPAGWADYQTTSTDYSNSEGILLLRDSSNQVVCRYARISTADGTRTLSIVTLGGSAYSWTDQCNLASYTAFPDVSNMPYCVTDGVNSWPLKSTSLDIYEAGVSADGADTSFLFAKAAAGIVAGVGAAALML
jgi:hypothetical protein